MKTPALLVIGHVACDYFGNETRLGGAAAFAARAAASLGIEVGLVTVAPSDHPLLAPLYATPNLTMHCVPAPIMTAFALDYSGPRRVVTLKARAPSLRLEDVPTAWRAAPAVYLAPVIGECDAELAGAMRGTVGAGLQGWLRRARPDGSLEPHVDALLEQPPTSLRLGIFSEEDHPRADALATRLAERVDVVALTRGPRGATLWADGVATVVAPAPAREVDPTGAGDVFGVVLTLALARGLAPGTAGALAAEAAARVVEGPGLGHLPTAGTRPPLNTLAV